MHPSLLLDDAAFLSAVRALGDSTPSDKDLEISRRYVALLTEQTSVDHLKSVDEMLAQVPTEFQAAVKGLTEAESFIFMAASAQLEKTTRALDRDWDLVHAIDRDGHTALHAAAAQGNTEVCEVLLSRGANASVQDYEGSFAQAHEDPEVGRRSSNLIFKACVTCCAT